MRTQNQISALLLLTLVMLFASCSREVTGCSDPESVNYNPEVTMDDGSCQYLADLYSGTWLLDLRARYRSCGITMTAYRDHEISITKLDRSLIQVNNLSGCGSNFMVSVSESGFGIHYGYNGCELGNGSADLTQTGLSFSFTSANEWGIKPWTGTARRISSD